MQVETEEKMSLAKSEETGSYIMLLNMVISLILDCYSVSFFIFSISQSHCLLLLLYYLPFSSPPSICMLDGLVLILVPSVPPISLHVIAVRLKSTVQASSLH